MPSRQSAPTPKASWQFDAIGTRWAIETVIPLSDSLRREMSDRIAAFDTVYSRFRPDSLVRRVATVAGEYVFPSDSVALMSLYRQLYDITSGAVTPLVGSTLEALGYDETYSFQTKAPASVPLWDDVMKWDGNILTTTQPVVLDVGAAGKGYLVDIIGQLLEDDGITSYVIDASGDVRHRGSEAQVIGLEHPDDLTRVIGAVRLNNQSLCASATNRRRWGDNLHHVIDGRTSAPATDVVATWVIADSTMVADGLATALFFVSPDDLQSLGSFQFVRMFASGEVEYLLEDVGELFV